MDAQLYQDPSDFSFISGYHPTPACDKDALVDVTDAAREAGLACSVALSRDAWTLCVAMNPAAQAAGCDERSRLHDVLSMLKWALGQSRRGSRVSISTKFSGSQRASGTPSLVAMPRIVVTIVVRDSTKARRVIIRCRSRCRPTESTCASGICPFSTASAMHSASILSFFLPCRPMPIRFTRVVSIIFTSKATHAKPLPGPSSGSSSFTLPTVARRITLPPSTSHSAIFLVPRSNPILRMAAVSLGPVSFAPSERVGVPGAHTASGGAAAASFGTPSERVGVSAAHPASGGAAVAPLLFAACFGRA